MKIFLDSGAYSAHNNGTSIDIQKYIDFIKENKDSIEVYANLDVIGSPEGTWQNQELMEKQGLTPLPVYHLGESTSFLDRAMEYPYFAVGGIASKLTSYKDLKEYLKTVFEKVCTKENNYLPSNKIHGFGIATPQLLVLYPWYSADTTSWVQYGRFGIILIPAISEGVFRYDLPPESIAISSRSKAIGEIKHFNQLGVMSQERVTNYLKEIGYIVGKTVTKKVDPDYVLKENEKWFDKKKKVIEPRLRIREEGEKIIEKPKMLVEKITVKGVCCDGEMRDAVNLRYFIDLEKYQKKWPWPWKVSSTKIDEIDPEFFQDF